MTNNIRSHLIRPTIKCNENCSFCNVTEETELDYREKTITEILIQVQQIIKKEWNTNNVKISISWWEPTLRQDLDKIILWIKKLGINNIELQTNATLLSKNLVEKLIKNGLNKFFISFHSIDKKIFEDYVWLKWIFEFVIANIKNLWNYENIEVILNPVISTKNYIWLKNYFNFVKKEFPFIKYISLSFVQPHGKAKKNKWLFLDYEIINIELTWILDYANKLWLIVNNPYCWLPVCIMRWDKYNNNCVEIIEWKNFIDKWLERKDNNKIYIKKCNNCIYKWLCWWIWKEYIEIFWDSWIKEITKY